MSNLLKAAKTEDGKIGVIKTLYNYNSRFDKHSNSWEETVTPQEVVIEAKGQDFYKASAQLLQNALK